MSRKLHLAAELVSSLLEAIYPEACILCQTQIHQESSGNWCDSGPWVSGLRFWDRPHLCRTCLTDFLLPDLVQHTLEMPQNGSIQVVAARPTDQCLVEVLGSFKYKGIRGLAWPLASLLVGALGLALHLRRWHSVKLVPVPLHARRQRERGFNQAEIMARLVGAKLGQEVAPDIARRVRSTGQQARLETSAQRQANLRGAFQVKLPPVAPGQRLVLVDDIVTSGATCGELASALRQAGWSVDLVIALGFGQRGS